MVPVSTPGLWTLPARAITGLVNFRLFLPPTAPPNVAQTPPPKGPPGDKGSVKPPWARNNTCDNFSGGNPSGSGRGSAKHWKCSGAQSCGYARNTLSSRHCGKCGLSWDFSQRTGAKDGSSGNQPPAQPKPKPIGGSPIQLSPKLAATAGKATEPPNTQDVPFDEEEEPESLPP